MLNNLYDIVTKLQNPKQAIRLRELVSFLRNCSKFITDPNDRKRPLKFNIELPSRVLFITD